MKLKYGVLMCSLISWDICMVRAWPLFSLQWYLTGSFWLHLIFQLLVLKVGNASRISVFITVYFMPHNLFCSQHSQIRLDPYGKSVHKLH